VNSEAKGLRTAVSLTEEHVDPNMDQGNTVTLNVLLSLADGVVSHRWRRYRMEGSDSDDGDRTSEVSLGYWVDSKRRSVPAVIFL
jgi:hypothetical protein